jgi:ABC-type multidrug transport system ATPase subunit/pSer/pThr/pTyr-binding forkhead associated (FHA) protein
MAACQCDASWGKSMALREAERDTAQDRVIIGSAETCDVRIEEPKVSRRHCAVFKLPEGFLIEDLQSRNGTYVNGQRIDRKTMVAFGAPVTLSKSIPFPWNEVALFLEGRNNDSPQPAKVVTIGRLPGNDLVLDDKTVSGRHARVIYEGGEVFIEDLGSRNGTFILGESSPIVRALIRPRDMLVLGKCQLPAGVFFGERESRRPNAAAGPEELLKTELGDSPAVAHGSLDLTGRQGIFLLGRDAGSDFQLDYPMVSLRHAELTINGSGISIKDLGSSNGTFVNHKRIRRPTRIVPGDVVALGSVWFVLSDDGRSLAPRTARGDITIEARGLGVEVSTGKRILENVSLSILPGELVGLMGPSGAGKSTLIAALNGYTPPTRGTVLINGQDLYGDYDAFRGMIGYVPQDDIMHSDLTVFEALYFTARLRLPTDYSDEEVRKRISKVLGELGLQGTEDTRIGNAERRGISGGQRKRVNVAMELLTDPPLLFLDEPTSGLSSEDALSLMKLLRQLADAGKTVILTIHQPSIDVFRLMDNLIVVGKDNAPMAAGQLAYYGPAYPDAIAFFEPGSAATTSPDAVLRGLATRSVRDWVGEYAESNYHRRFVANRLQKRRDSPPRRLARRRPAGSRTQFMTLVRRGLAVKMKDTWNTGVLLLQAPLIALLIGLVFGPQLAGGVTLETFPDVGRSVATTVFLLGVSALWFGCSNSARDIVSEAAIYRRERMVGLGIPSYLASKVTILALLCAFQCGVLLMVVGWLGGLKASWLELYASLFMASVVGVAIGLTVSAAARTGEVAAGVLPLVILPMVILGGVLLPLHELPRSPVPMNIVAATMPSRWAFESLLLPEAKARAVLDETATPPALLSPAEATGKAWEASVDMAEPFFRSEDRWRKLAGFPFFVMQIQAIFLVGLVGALLKAKDNT